MHKTNLFFPILVAAVVAGAALPSASAFAKARSWRVGQDSYYIRLGNLDMSSPAGRQEALARAEKAATTLCAERYNVGVDIDACVADSLKTAARANGALRLAMTERTGGVLARR